MAEPTDAELRSAISKILLKVDLEETGIKKFTKLLSREFGGIDFRHKAQFIKATITEIINEETEEELGSSDDERIAEEQEESEVEEVAVSKKISKRKLKTKSGAKTKSGNGGGLSAMKEISDELAAFLGQGKRMARTEIVKKLWEHIKENGLQNPSNMREILLDEKLKAVFGQHVHSFTMFTMNKYIGAHVEPFKPVDLTALPTSQKKRKSKAVDNKEKKKRKPSGGLQAPYQLSPELARVTGKQILPRPQVVKKLWEYIRANNLQDPEDKRTILCDTKFKLLMGGQTKVTIFSMQKYISEHLLEKLDASYYIPSDIENQSDIEDDDE
jgi:upstream activation factor subunit UAF30